MIEQTRFLSTVFLCSEFNFLENIYSGVNFCWEVIFICGNLFLRIAGIKGKNAKIRTHKNFLPHGGYIHTYIHTLLARPHGAFQSQFYITKL